MSDRANPTDAWPSARWRPRWGAAARHSRGGHQEPRDDAHEQQQALTEW